MGNLIENQMKYTSLLFIVFASSALSASAQDYHAIQGSSYAGSLGVGNNPASIVATPYKWDLTVLALQAKTATNMYTVENYSLISSAKNSAAYTNDGNYKRFTDFNFNINLLNARIALSRQHAIAFGINLRGNGRLKTDVYNYSDTLQNMHQFFGINEGNNILSGSFSGSSWVEAFATYSRTLWDDNQGRLNGGITLKGTRGIAGAFAQLTNGHAERVGTDTAFTLQSAAARYGYSYNFDGWQNGNTTSQNLKDFVNNTRGGFSVDLGFEYLIKPQGITTINDPDNYYDYDWKIGLSLLDWGYNQYRYGNKSRSSISPASNVTDVLLDQKFDSLTTFNNFNDSLASVVNGFSTINGKFKVHNPTRLVLNIDKPLGNDFYINADISVNLNKALAGSRRFYTQELSFLTLTPRWETRSWGVYFPMQYNMEKQFWIGGAFKAGPLLIGVHNWANVFSRNKIQNGGAYLALIIRSPGNTGAKTDKRLDCPKY
jgi:hypothetical protein